MAQVIKKRLEEKELSAPEDGEPLELVSGQSQGQKLQPKPAGLEDPELQSMRKKISEPNSAASLPKVVKSQHQTNEYIPLDELLKDRKSREGARTIAKVVTQPKPVTSNLSQTDVQEVKSIDDIASCSLETLQNQGFQALSDQLVALVREHGYFAVILRFESSPLYKEYLDAGKAWLSPNSAGKPSTSFPKAEFEKVTDILRNMQHA